MHRLLLSLFLFSFASSIVYAKDNMYHGALAYQAARCISYMELAGKQGDVEYIDLFNLFYKNMNKYIDSIEVDTQSYRVNKKLKVPLYWHIYVSENKFPRDVLVGRVLEWTTGIESERVGSEFSKNEKVIPESAGELAYKNANCALLH